MKNDSSIEWVFRVLQHVIVGLLFKNVQNETSRNVYFFKWMNLLSLLRPSNSEFPVSEQADRFSSLHTHTQSGRRWEGVRERDREWEAQEVNFFFLPLEAHTSTLLYRQNSTEALSLVPQLVSSWFGFFWLCDDDAWRRLCVSSSPLVVFY